MRLFVILMLAQVRWACARLDANVAQSWYDAVTHRAPRFLQHAARVRSNAAWLNEYSYSLAAGRLADQYRARYPLMGD